MAQVSCNETVLENYAVLVYVYYTHPGYQTSICGKKKNLVYFIRIFTVGVVVFWPTVQKKSVFSIKLRTSIICASASILVASTPGCKQ